MPKEGNIEVRGIFVSVLILFGIFLGLPMATLFVKSLICGDHVGLGNYIALVTSVDFLKSFGNSFLISCVAAAVTTVLAFLLSYALNNTALPRWFCRMVGIVTIAPMFLPTITYGFVIIYSFGREGLITRLLGFQLLDIYGFQGLLLGYVIYTLPIACLLINNTFKYVDRNFVVVSQVMGDSPLRTFFVTSVRPLLGTLGVAFVQSFSLSFTDFGIPASIGGKFDVIAIRLYNEMLGALPNFASGAAIAVLMLVPAILSIILMGYLERFNFRYNKISQVEIKQNLWRDGLFGTGGILFCVGIAGLFLIMFLAPFFKNWPYDTGFTLQKITALLQTRNLVNTYCHSLMVAAATAVLGTAVAFGAALVTARSRMSKKAGKVIDSLALVTNSVPGMVLGIAFLFAFSGTSLQNTFLILIVCNVVHFFTTPYFMGKSCLEKMNAGWESTAALMGDSWGKTLFRIILPNSRSTLLEIFSYFFINAMITVSAVIFITGARTSVITTKIKELQHYAKFDEIFLLSLLILLTNLFVRWALSRLGGKRKSL